MPRKPQPKYGPGNLTINQVAKLATTYSPMMLAIGDIVAENKKLQKVKSENVDLRKQVSELEKQLGEKASITDSEIKEQVEMATRNVLQEAFGSISERVIHMTDHLKSQKVA